MPILIRNIENSLGGPILLPELNPANARNYDGTAIAVTGGPAAGTTFASMNIVGAYPLSGNPVIRVLMPDGTIDSYRADNGTLVNNGAAVK